MRVIHLAVILNCRVVFIRHNYIRHLQIKDVWKVSIRDKIKDVYTAFWRFLVRLSKTDEALCAAEQGRAQALMELMKIQYDLQLLSSEFPDVQQTFSNEARSTSTQTVFVALEGKTINLWVLCEKKCPVLTKHGRRERCSSLYKAVKEKCFERKPDSWSFFR